MLGFPHHRSKEIKDCVKEHNRNIIYTILCIAPTPELNPIENAFSVIKNAVRRMNPTSFEQLKEAITIGVESLDGCKCRNMFKNSFETNISREI